MAWQEGTFGAPSTLWGDSLGSDHALLRLDATIPSKLQRLPEDRTQGYATDISPQKWEDWTRILDALTFPPPSPPPLVSTTDIDDQ